jgi:hypothetical protein
VLEQLKPGASVVGLLAPANDPALAALAADDRLHLFPLQQLPRTTRAQAMDVLSSQAGMAGYKAALIAAERAPRFFPMLTTAAGTVRPAKVLVIGAGVAACRPSPLPGVSVHRWKVSTCAGNPRADPVAGRALPRPRGERGGRRRLRGR